MYLTGFADEASAGIDGQIKATKELGWKWIESRNIDGKNITDISDADFDKVCEKLAASGVGINCFGSAICNWGKKIDEPFDSSLAELSRGLPRMKRLGTKYVRMMSFAVLPDRGPNDQMADERFRRLREVVARCNDAGVTAVHENCMNYGGMGYTFTEKLLANVPGLKLVFDTGNPVFTDDRTKAAPYPKQSAWEFYSHVKEFIAYVHIKDGYWDYDKKQTVFTFAGEGDGDVRRIVKDLLDSGYDGGFSMEPHLAAVYHDPSVTAPEEIKYRNYVDYGRKFMDLIRAVGYANKL